MPSVARIERVYVQVVPDEIVDLSWLDQTPAQLGSIADAVLNLRRKRAYENGDWEMCGVRLAADVVIEHAGRTDEVLTLTTPGVWGIESDSGEEYFRETATDDSGMLQDDLEALFDRFTVYQALNTAWELVYA